MGVVWPASWGCGESQKRVLKGSGDLKNLCKGKVSSAQSPTRTVLQAHVVVEVSMSLLNLPFAFCTLDPEF